MRPSGRDSVCICAKSGVTSDSDLAQKRVDIRIGRDDIRDADLPELDGYVQADARKNAVEKALVLVRAGDTLKIRYSASDIERLNIISSWEFTD